MSVEQVTLRLQQLKKQAEDAGRELITAQADMRNLEAQRDSVVEELKAMDLTPETLPGRIAELEAERDRLMNDAERLLKGEDVSAGARA